MMPRAARKVSSTGIYHIMIRGINRGVIFNDNTDKDRFLEIMEKTKEETSYELYAYCLMDNHAHLLMKENEVSISLIMKKICGKYGSWYNYRHHRVGHLFQDRFKSECVETNSYFIVVLKYILNNPVKANMVDMPENYKWSSYHEYIKKNKLTDTMFFLEMLDQNNRKAKKIFIDELKKEEQQIINLTIDNVRRTDREAEEIITREMKLLKVEGIGQMTVDNRIHFIKSLKAKGITNRQIMGILGLSKSKVIGI